MNSRQMELPTRWQWAKLSECVDILDSRRVPVNSDDRARRVTDKQGSDLVPYFGATGQVGWIDDFLFDEELVLLGEDGAPFLESDKPKAYMVRGKSWVNNHAHVLRARAGLTTNTYLLHYLNQFDYHGYVTGTTRYKLSQAPMRNVPVKVPPLAEQGRIVAKIEELFTRLDAGVAALRAAQAQLKRYRQSVLQAAVEGRLVDNESQAEVGHPLAERFTAASSAPLAKRAGRLWGAGVVPSLTEEERLALPKGWTWTKVQDLGYDPVDAVQVGPMSMQSRQFSDVGVPVLNVGCVKWGYFDESKLNFLPSDVAANFERYRIQPGDILFTRSGTVGRCAVATEHHAHWLMTFHLLRIRPDKRICVPEYLRIVLEGAPHIRRQTREASIGTTRAGFNTRLLAELDVPLPPVDVQRRIIVEVERCLTTADKLDVELSSCLLRQEHLRQSILKRAFEGKLVPQDPADEPASVLLDRIRAERQPAPTPKPKAVRRRPAPKQMELF